MPLSLSASLDELARDWTPLITASTAVVAATNLRPLVLLLLDLLLVAVAARFRPPAHHCHTLPLPTPLAAKRKADITAALHYLILALTGYSPSHFLTITRPPATRDPRPRDLSLLLGEAPSSDAPCPRHSGECHRRASTILAATLAHRSSSLRLRVTTPLTQSLPPLGLSAPPPGRLPTANPNRQPT